MRSDVNPGTSVAEAMVRYPKVHDATTTVGEIRRLFEDDHVHMALIVDSRRALVSTIERSDLVVAVADHALAVNVGTLDDRTIGSSVPLETATRWLVESDRRRLAVVDRSSRLLGLLCLNRKRTGYCTDEGIRERADELRTGPQLGD